MSSNTTSFVFSGTTAQQIDAIILVKQNYGNHPLKSKFCRCGWICCPPAYPGDYFDCLNPGCGKSYAPTKKQIARMAKGVASSKA